MDVVNEYVTLKKSGGLYWKAPCPFHQEKTPSFTVSPDKDIFYCFGCHESGDVISFVAKIENLSQYEACQFLVEKYNITIPDTILKSNSQQSQSSKDEKDSYFQLCKLIAYWCHEQLFKHATSLNYLHSRKFNQNSIQQFMLGFLPKSHQAIDSLLHFVSKKGFLTQDLIKSGFLFESRTGLYSPFENRIIFPIRDHLGRFCGFGGRIFLPEDTRPKYYNSKENHFFQKGHILFGLDVSKRIIQEQKTAFLVEGYTDCIAMHNYGYQNSIATLGTACTIDHLKLVARYTQQLYVLYDSDNAGQQAILRLAKLCWNIDIETKVICLPSGTDPASFLMANKDLKPFVHQATDIFTFFLQSKGKDYQQKSLKDKIQATTSIIDIIKNLKDPLKQDILLLKASEILQIPLESLRKEFTTQETDNTSTKKQAQQPQQHSTLEEKIISVILHNPKILNNEHETALLAGLPEPYNSLLQSIINVHAQHSDNFIETLQASSNDETRQLIHKLLFAINHENLDLAFEQMLIQFQKKHWKSIVLNIKMKLKQATQEADSEKIQNIVKAFQNLKAKLLKSGRL